MDKSLEAMSIMDLLTIRENDRGIEWLKRAVELEFATIPPYLCGAWSIGHGHSGK
jgi:hypothetical protein